MYWSKELNHINKIIIESPACNCTIVTPYTSSSVNGNLCPHWLNKLGTLKLQQVLTLQVESSIVHFDNPSLRNIWNSKFWENPEFWRTTYMLQYILVSEFCKKINHCRALGSHIGRIWGRSLCADASPYYLYKDVFKVCDLRISWRVEHLAHGFWTKFFPSSFMLSTACKDWAWDSLKYPQKFHSAVPWSDNVIVSALKNQTW